jgi:hypothetical protein
MSDDTFTAVAGLIALINDAKACAKRLAELQAAIAAAEQAQAQLEAARIANERAFAETKADLDRRQAPGSPRARSSFGSAAMRSISARLEERRPYRVRPTIRPTQILRRTRAIQTEC